MKPILNPFKKIWKNIKISSKSNASTSQSIAPNLDPFQLEVSPKSNASTSQSIAPNLDPPQLEEIPKSDASASQLMTLHLEEASESNTLTYQYTKPNLNLFHLQEIVILVGKYLKRHQIASFLTVCKLWHTALRPLLYREIIWNGKGYPTHQSIISNGGFIEKLEVYSRSFFICLPSKSALDSFTQLSRVSLCITPDTSIIDSVSKLIDQNSGLREFEDYNACFISSIPILNSLLNCKNLKKIVIKSLQIQTISPEQEEMINHLHLLFTRLEELVIKASTLPEEIFLDKGRSYPLLKALTVGCLFREESTTINFILKCRNLQSLSWDYKHHGLTKQKVNPLFKVHCKKLTDLTITYDNCKPVPHKILGMILNAGTPLTGITLYVSRLGKINYTSLSRHYSTLTKIDLGSDPYFCIHSDMVKDMLAQCPNLAVLRAPEISASDFLSAMSNRSGSANLALRKLSVYIYGFFQHTNEWQLPVVEQLAKFKNLHDFDFGVSPLKDYLPQGEDYKCGIQLRFNGGLKQLKSLRHLEKIGYPFRGDSVYKDEITWMVVNWPDLSEILLDAYCSREGWANLTSALEPYHIEVSRKYSYEGYWEDWGYI